MRILVDCTTLSRGGGVQVASAFLDGLRGSHDLDWFVAFPETLQYSFAVPKDRAIALVKRGKADIVNIAWKLMEAERSLSPAVVFTVFGPPYFSARRPHVAGFALPRLIYDRDDVPDYSFFDEVRRAFSAVKFRLLDHTIVETETVRNRLSSRLGVQLDRISVVENSLNPVFSKNDRRDTSAGECRFVVLVPSAYYRHKNLEIVPRAAKHLVQWYGIGDVEFWFTIPSSSPEWQCLKALSEALGVSQMFKTLGNLDLIHLADAYRRCSAVLLPTLLEASTAVYPEAFWFRKPLITSRRDFAKELCGDAAMYADPLSAAEIASALVALRQDAGLRSRLIAAGDRRLLSNYPSPEVKFAKQMSILKRFGG